MLHFFNNQYGIHMFYIHGTNTLSRMKGRAASVLIWIMGSRVVSGGVSPNLVELAVTIMARSSAMTLNCLPQALLPSIATLSLHNVRVLLSHLYQMLGYRMPALRPWHLWNWHFLGNVPLAESVWREYFNFYYFINLKPSLTVNFSN